MLKFPMRAGAMACLGLAWLGLSVAHAAVIEPDELSSLTAAAQRFGAVPVSVTLQVYGLQDVRDDLARIRASATERARSVLTELGEEALSGGRSASGVGALDLYVTSRGLSILAGSSSAVSFRTGKGWEHRVDGGVDGRYLAIASLLRDQGFAEVVITFDVDDFEFDLAKSGDAIARTSARGLQQASSKMQATLSALTDAEALGTKASALAKISKLIAPETTVRVTLGGLLKILGSEGVRSVRPVGYRDARPTATDAAAIATAKSAGFADVLVTLRSPYDGAHRTPDKFNEYVQNNRRLLNAALADYGITSLGRDFSEFAAMEVRLSLKQLNSIKASKDSRFVGVTLNQPVASLQLRNSTPVQMNMPTAWNNTAYWGTGQNIVVMDSGVQAAHLMLRNSANTASRVTSEACFGTAGTFNTPTGLVTYRSNCFNGTNAASSSAGPGTAAPVTGCQANAPGAPTSACAHGTNVASIAASIPVSNQSGTWRGVATGASIAAYQVFSFDTAAVAQPNAFLVDVLGALQRVVGLTIAGSTNNPWTVNLSLGGQQHNLPCHGSNYVEVGTDGPNYQAVTNAVVTLKSRGVPVIAAAGNDNYPDAVSWPACVPGVVKVAAAINDQTGSAVGRFSQTGGSNVVNPLFFPGETFWIAPGGGAATNSQAQAGTLTFIEGANFLTNASTTTLGGFAGTSQAAPHVAGVYAIVKAAVPGVTVDQVVSTLQNFNAVLPGAPFTVDNCVNRPSPSQYACGPRQERYNRIRLP